MSEQNSLRSRWLKTITIFLYFYLLTVQSSISSEVHVRYTVRQDESLSLIASNHLKPSVNWRDLAKYNDIQDENKIVVGTRLKIPLNWLRRSEKGVRLISSSGDVKLKKSTGEVRLAFPGVSLNNKDKIITGDDGFAIIEFPDETQISLKSNANIEIGSVVVFGNKIMIESNLQQTKGRSDVNVNSIKHKNRKFNVITPAAVASVRGTTFNIEVKDGTTFLETNEGSVVFKNIHGEVKVDGGYSSVATLNKQPSIPSVTHNPPVLINHQKTYKNIPIEIDFEYKQNLKNWTLEIQSALDRTETAYTNTSNEPIFKINYLAPGQYHMKAWTIDQNDRKSKLLLNSFEVNYKIEKYITNLKLDERHIKGGALVLNLPSLESSKRYVIQVTDAEDGKNVVWREIIQNENLVINNIKGWGGHYLNVEIIN